MSKILVIRGGALGDFILSLPVLAALKKDLPAVEIEILGYPRIAQIARGHYAKEVRSLEESGFARFFGERTELPPQWCDYISGFAQIVSFLYDPDGIFTRNLQRAGARHILSLPHKPDESEPVHATAQFARGLEKIGIIVDDFIPRIFPNQSDQKTAREILGQDGMPTITLHPGSGSPLKNWPVPNWCQLLEWLLAQTGLQVAVVLGEAEEGQTAAQFARFGAHARVKILRGLSLPVLAAVLAQSRQFMGHDSGVSHLAAAVGTPVISLFGPTNPVVWHPVGATVIRKGVRLDEILVTDVQFALAKPLGLG